MGTPFARRRHNAPHRRYDPRHFLAIGVVAALAARPAHAEVNDYPTSARADYVIGCMAANCNTREALLNRQLDCRNYAYEHGIDMPEITDWKWPL